MKVGEEIFIFTDKRFVCRSNRDVAFIGVKIGFRVRWECIVVCIPIFYGDVIRLHMIDYTKIPRHVAVKVSTRTSRDISTNVSRPRHVRVKVKTSKPR